MLGVRFLISLSPTSHAPQNMAARKQVLLLIVVDCLLSSSWALSSANQSVVDTHDKVLFFASKVLDEIYVPVARYPLLTWMDVQHGRYPNSKTVSQNVDIGQPISIVVHVQDRSRLYDAVVGDCIAFNGDNEDVKSVQIYPDSSDSHRQNTLSWSKEKDESGNIVLYSTFPAFKLPERNSLNLTCNLEICYSECHE